jgi:hypothetical protein
MHTRSVGTKRNEVSAFSRGTSWIRTSRMISLGDFSHRNLLISDAKHAFNVKKCSIAQFFASGMSLRQIA